MFIQKDRTQDKFLSQISSTHAINIPYFPAHKKHRDFFIRNLKKNDEGI